MKVNINGLNSGTVQFIAMPRKGYKSITVRDEIYNELLERYNENKEALLKQGITSFSGYVTRLLYSALEKNGE